VAHGGHPTYCLEGLALQRKQLAVPSKRHIRWQLIFLVTGNLPHRKRRWAKTSLVTQITMRLKPAISEIRARSFSWATQRLGVVARRSKKAMMDDLRGFAYEQWSS